MQLLATIAIILVEVLEIPHWIVFADKWPSQAFTSQIFQGALAKQNRPLVTAVFWQRPALLWFNSSVKPPRTALKWIELML